MPSRIDDQFQARADTAPAVRKALEDVRRQLLDFSKRNPLLNYRPKAGTALRLLGAAPSHCYGAIQSDRSVTVVSVPEDPLDAAEGRQRDVETRAKELGLSTEFNLERLEKGPAPKALSLTGLHYSGDLDARLRQLSKKTKTLIDETGTNTLHLVFGFLEHFDSKASKQGCLAPLICAPVRLVTTVRGGDCTHELSASGEDAYANPALHEYLRKEFGIELPPLPENGDLQGFFHSVRQSVKSQPHWRVEPSLTLALLSFANMELVKDLTPEVWTSDDGECALDSHPLIRRVLSGFQSESPNPDPNLPEGDRRPGLLDIDLPLVYDADGSQAKALHDIARGKSLVIEGPPGTGKSQTITNVLAQAINQGKRVLFIAEKSAALNVVKRRLEQAGLGALALELHGTKVSTGQVLQSLKTAIELKPGPTLDTSTQLNHLRGYAARLHAYADVLNLERPEMLGLTLHQLIWKGESHRAAAGPSVAAVEKLTFPFSGQMGQAELQELVTLLSAFQEHYRRVKGYGASHGLWGLQPREVTGEQVRQFSTWLAQHEEACHRFFDACSSAKLTTGLALCTSSLDDVGVWSGVVSDYRLRAGKLPKGVVPLLVSPTDPAGVRARSVVQGLAQEQQRHSSEKAYLASVFGSTLPAVGPWSDNDLKAWAYQTFEARAVSDVRRAAAECLVLLQQARRELKELAQGQSRFDSAGLTAEQLEQTCVVAELLSNVRQEVLRARHPGLQQHGAMGQLDRAQQRQGELKTQREELARLFLLELVPDAETLKGAISAIRGAGWLSLLTDKGYRNACALYKAIRIGANPPDENEQRAVELHRLLGSLNAEAAWATPELKRAVGRDSLTLDDDWTDVHEAAQWCAKVNASLEVAPEGLRFEAVAATEREIAGHLRRAQGAQRLQASLASAAQALKRLGVDWHPALSQTVAEGLNEASVDVERLLQLATELCARHLATTSFGQAIDAEVRLHGLRLLKQALDGNQAAKQLLGPHFAGAKTDTAALLEAHSLGASLLASSLPPGVAAWVLASTSENLGTFSAALEEVSRGVVKWRQFVARMSQLGPFSEEDWVGSCARTDAYELARVLPARAGAASQAADQLGALSQFLLARDRLREQGLVAFLQRIGSGSGALDVKHLVDTVLWKLYATMAVSVVRGEPLLTEFNGVDHTLLQKQFANLDRELIKARGAVLLHGQLAARKLRLVEGNQSAKVHEKTEMAALHHFKDQTRPRVKLRQLLSMARQSVQALKPCFMMSPQAVARYLVPREMEFDLVVMDEASQMRPQDAFGAIARGTQLVVVGDSKQMPPTAFFNRAVEEGADTSQTTASEDAESILDLCKSHLGCSHMLRWHYRSRHESLIAFSNRSFYDGGLFVFPAPRATSEELGLRFVHVEEGEYESNVNLPEAQRVVDAALRHMRERPEMSLGIVTLNQRQMDAIEERLFEAVQNLPYAQDFLEKHRQRDSELFVKNLESVQGDERDCIFISTTFGKAPGTSAVYQNFGPVSRDTGWRRLNVLITRARLSTTLFSSMLPADIKVGSTTPKGTRSLRDFLQYALSGRLEVSSTSAGDVESPFEAAVKDLLEKRGYSVTPQLGVSRFRIDLAVKSQPGDPEYLAAIECDGRTYHSGFEVRDRDRIRQEILEGLGWRGKIHRIWSTDWFRDPTGEARRLLDFLSKRKAASPSKPRVARDAPAPAPLPAEKPAAAIPPPAPPVVAAAPTPPEAHTGSMRPAGEATTPAAAPAHKANQRRRKRAQAHHDGTPSEGVQQHAK